MWGFPAASLSWKNFPILYSLCMCAKSAQSCLAVCDLMDCSPPGSSIHGILQARILELPCPPPGKLPNPGTEPTSLTSPALASGFFTIRATWEVPSIPYSLLISQTIMPLLLSTVWVHATCRVLPLIFLNNSFPSFFPAHLLHYVFFSFFFFICSQFNINHSYFLKTNMESRTGL